MNDDMGQPGDAWEHVAAAEVIREHGVQKVSDAWMAECARCLAVVEAEVAKGLVVGIPTTSATMVILHRIAAAIRDGG